MIRELDFSQFYPIMDAFDHKNKKHRGWSYVPLAGWLRGDEGVEAFEDCEEVPERTGWRARMAPKRIMDKLDIPENQFNNTKQFYKAIVKYIKDSGIDRDAEGHHLVNVAFVLQVHPEDVEGNRKFKRWFVLSADEWTDKERKKFKNKFGIEPRKITDNVWLISEKGNKNDI